MVASKVIKTYVMNYIYITMSPMHSLVFDACQLFVNNDDSAASADSDDALFKLQFDYRLGAPALPGASALVRRVGN